MNGSAPQSGFALAETLVASAIIAMMMAMTYQAIGSGARAASMVADRRLGLLIAQSTMAEVQADPMAHAGGESGHSGLLTWRLDISAYDAPDGAGGVPLERVTVHVIDPRSSHDLVSLSRLRLTR